MKDDQRADMARTFPDIASAGLLDFVSAWYRKAAEYMADNPSIKTAFVSTNSITQGEQVGVLWPDMLRRGVKIHFAHRTFRWASEARGRAAVHCVIIGFALQDAAEKRLFDYETAQAEAHEIKAKNINPYLADATDLVIPRRSTSLCDVPEIGIGNKPIDGGHYLFTPQERDEFLLKEPAAAPYFRRWLGADEFLYAYERYCLWLGDCLPDTLRKMPEALKRVEAVRNYRLASKSLPTKKLAATPTRFHVENMPKTSFLIIPEVSSEKRLYIPLGFMTPETFCSNKLRIFPKATLFHFGILQSTMHMAWTRHVTGRLESRYQYSVSIVYNNFPWPQDVSDKQRKAIEESAQAILYARAKYQGSSLAHLYDPLTMPPDLLKAHHKLDAAVDAAYSKKKFSGDSDRAAFLFEQYQQLASPLENRNARRSRRARAHSA